MLGDVGADSDSDGEAIGGDSSSDEECDLGALLRKSSSLGLSRSQIGATTSFRALDEEDSFEDEVGKEFDAAFALVEHDAGLKTLPARVKKDPLYDPRMDERDQAWVDARRQKYQPKKRSGLSQKLPNSDAVLNCPCCMSMICLDCQRHEKYSSQYRAMFVFNCKVNFDETLKIPAGMDKKELRKKKLKSRKRKLDAEESQGPVDEEPGTSGIVSHGGDALGDDFHPVTCATCGTRVAVYDTEEVYHFFHVLASH